MTRHRGAGWLSLLLAAVAPACAATDVRPAADVTVAVGQAGPDAEAFAEAFFGAGLPPAELEARLRDALARYPTSGTVHEVAAYWAALQSDDHASWEHFLRAASDLSNPDASLDLLEIARHNLTRGETLATATTLERIASASPSPEVRAEARYELANYLRVLDRRPAAAHAIASLGFVGRAALLGAFDNEDGKGLSDAYPPETKVDLAATVAGSVVPIRWRTVEADAARGAFALQNAVYPSQGAVAYLAFWAYTPAAAAGTLRLTTTAPVAAWVNHASVVRDEKVQRVALDNVAAPLVLPAGWSEVLVKTAVKAGPWSLGVRLAGASGEPIEGLVTAPAPPAGFVAPQAGATGVASTAARQTAAGSSSRAAFAAARRRVLLGFHADGLAALEQLLARSPTSPVLRFATADAAVHDRQVERALDLLSAGLDPAMPGFREARARIYREKDLLSQAEHDLAVVTAARPSARVARMDLADVLGRRAWHSDRLAMLTDVARRWPDSSWAYTALGSAYETLGYGGRAEAAYATAAALDATSVTALRARRRLLEARQAMRDAEGTFDRLEIVNPGDLSDLLAHAELERQRDRPSDSMALLALATAASPDHPTPYLRRGQLAEERGATREAIALYERAEERDPKDSWIAQRLDHLRPPTADALSAYVATEEDVEQALRRPTARGDAASHIETLLSDTATLLSGDGSVRVVSTVVERALTQHGRDELVHMRLPVGGEVRIIHAYAESPDGKRQESSSVEKNSVRFRNLEVGSSVVLKYAFYPRRTGALADDYSHDTPFALLARHVDRMRWVIVAARQKAIHVDSDPRVVHTVKRTDTWDVHEFVREGVAALPAEPGMVPLAEQQPHVVVTTIPSWDAFVRWEKAILDESFPADPAIDALALKLTAGAISPRARLAKLFAYVAQEIRYQQEYESILAGWQPHRSSVVLERKYGDCKDKATLLIALARAVGIKVEFVTLATHGLGRPTHDIAVPRFNHAIAHVPAQPGFDAPFFLDATVDALDLWNLREDDQGASGLVLEPTTGTWSFVDIPYGPSSDEETRMTAEVDVTSEATIAAKVHVDVRGTHASSLRKTLRSDDQARQVYDLIASGLFSGAKLVHASAPDHESVEHPVAIDEELDLAGSVRREGDHVRLKVPNDVDDGLVKLEVRQTTLDLGAPRRSSSEVVVRLGPALRLVEKPAPVDVVDPCFAAHREVKVDGVVVKVQTRFEQTCTRVSVDDYPRFRSAMELAHARLDTAVVFDAPVPRTARLHPAR